MKRLRRAANMTVAEAILARVDMVPEAGCWLWSGALGTFGYGMMSVGNETRGAHRWAYRAFVGEIPKGMYVCHRCDVPCCVNPAHLFLGTPSDNMNDCAHKGRRPHGRQHWKVKLTEAEVIAIRAAGDYSTNVARRYGVSRATIYAIGVGQSWHHLKGEK